MQAASIISLASLGRTTLRASSLVMTARANGVEPFEYLSEVFEQLPAAMTVEAIEALLPWNLKPILEQRRKCLHSADSTSAHG